jgi:Na+-translocating ferredoxin:NAD+ oxidoreductase RnfD subunit
MMVLHRPQDPRLYQIAVLGTLVCYGIGVLDFGIHWYNALAIATTALAVQWIGSRLARLPSFDPRSPMITALSLILLLRTDVVLLAIAAAAIAIGSKFLLRFNGKHMFNPANVAIVSMMMLSDHAWISTGQWGNAAFGAFALACLGFIVLTRAKRAETTSTFVIVYAALLLCRTFWLGDPITIPLHHMQNGALLIFAFFMISDPKTTPNTAAGRIFYATIVATIAFAIQFVFYQPNGPILALVMSAPLVPIIDFLRRGRNYTWTVPRIIKPSIAIVHPEKIKGVF